MELKEVLNETIINKIKEDDVFRLQRAHAYGLDVDNDEDMKILFSIETFFTTLSGSIDVGNLDLGQAAGIMKIFIGSINAAFDRNIDLRQAQEILARSMPSVDLEQMKKEHCAKCPDKEKCASGETCH